MEGASIRLFHPSLNSLLNKTPISIPEELYTYFNQIIHYEKRNEIFPDLLCSRITIVPCRRNKHQPRCIVTAIALIVHFRAIRLMVTGNAMVFDPQELGFPLIEGSYSYGNGTFYFLL
jgi:hypothetical protein